MMMEDGKEREEALLGHQALLMEKGNDGMDGVHQHTWKQMAVARAKPREFCHLPTLCRHPRTLTKSLI